MNIEVETITMYHGSLNQKGIPQPRRDIPGHTFGRIDMDFGTGFYLTLNANQAKEWAVRKGNNGSLNTYRLNLDGLHILHLELEACYPLCWMTVIEEIHNYIPMSLFVQLYDAYHTVSDSQALDEIGDIFLAEKYPEDHDDVIQCP